MIHDFMKTIISAIKSWVSNEIKDASKANIADWNQSDIEASNYIKNRTHWEEKNLEVIVNKTSLNFSGCSSPAWGQKKDGYLYVPIPLKLIPKQTYEVIFDDIIYPCIAFYDNIYNNVVIGNEALVNSTGDDNNVPFAIGNYEEGLEYAYVIALDQNQHTFTIAQTSTTIHKLDLKYLPDDIGVQADWNETDETSKSFILNKPNIMDKENPSGIGSFSINRVNGSMIGNNSCAIGNEVIACGENSIASGFNVIATKPNQYAIGKYNIFENIYIEKNSESPSFSPIKINQTYKLALSYEFSPLTGIFSLISPFSAKIAKFNYTNYYLFEDGGTSGTTMYKLSPTVYGDDNRGAYIYTSELAIDDGNLLIVGNGTVNDARSNAHTLDWEGNAWFAGDVYVGSTSGINKDEGSKKLATEEYVQTEIANNKQSDWSAKEGEVGHINNRTHYEDITPNLDTVEWDGNTDNKLIVSTSDPTLNLVKISDVRIPLDTWTIMYGLDYQVKQFNSDEVQNWKNYVDQNTSWAYIPPGVVNVSETNAQYSRDGVTAVLPEIGIYICVSVDDPASAVERLTISGYGAWYTRIDIKQLDEKFIPDTIARVSDIPEIPVPEIINSNWNAKEDEAGYVLNRTHWDYEVLEEFIPETVLDGDRHGALYFNGSYQNIYYLDGIYNIEDNTEYIITVDGVSHRKMSHTTLSDGDSGHYIMKLGDDSLPVRIGQPNIDKGYTYLYLDPITAANQGNPPYTISVQKCVTKAHSLDEKYIPDTIARVADVKAMIDEVKTINLDNYYLQIPKDNSEVSYTGILSELILNNINQNITTTSIEISQNGDLFKDIINDPSPQLNNLAMTWVDDSFVIINNIAIIKTNNEVTTIGFNVSLFETNIQKFINIHAAISINQIDIAVNVL